jgi:hypothetical protein
METIRGGPVCIGNQRKGNNLMSAVIESESLLGLLDSRSVIFHPHSFADDAGRLFRSGGQLFRGIKPSHAPFFARLFKDGAIEKLMRLGLLIETEQTDLKLEGYPMVLSHRDIAFVSYPNEWCAPMLKDAALTIIELAIELSEAGLTLKDAHPWNVLFDFSKPVYVDFTSIAPQTDSLDWGAYDEFCRFCLYPLILMCNGQERIARALLPEYRGVLRSELLAASGSFAPTFVLSKLFGRVSKSTLALFRRSSRSQLSVLKEAKRSLEKLSLRSDNDTCEELSSNNADCNTQREIVIRVLSELRPADVLDFSVGESWAPDAARLGARVISATPNSVRAAETYWLARHEGLSILPLILDFVKPTPSVGYRDHYSIAADQRLKCELVLALGLARRLIEENHFNFDLIAEGLASFCTSRAVLDFRGSSAEVDQFIEALLARFTRVRKVFGDPTILVCEK